MKHDKMKPHILLSSLVALFISSEVQAITVDLDTNPRVLTERKIKVDYASCDMGFYDDDEYIDLDNEDDCHKIHMPNQTIQDKYGKSVKSCCGFHGYMAYGSCEGKDDQGEEYEISNMKVCQDHTLEDPDETNHISKISLDCPQNCMITRNNLVKNPELKEEQDGKISLKLGNKNVDNFCFAYTCGQRGKFMSWVTSYEACVCSKETFREQNVRFKKRHPDIPLCCGENGTLSKNDQNCYEDGNIIEPAKTDSKGAYQCNWKSKQKFEVLHEKDLKAVKPVCVGVIKNPTETFVGGVVCHSACSGTNKCFQSCNEKGKGWRWTDKDYISLEKVVSFTDILGTQVDEDLNIEYDIEGQIPCHKIAKNYENQQIYPEENCHNSAEFLENGDMMLPERNITLKYKEFCIAPTTKECLKGRYMVQACLPKKEMKAKFSFYFIFLSISITCLLLTILVYVFFHKALLRSNYNKIMVNFAASLLLAFLILVINQNHGSEFSKICCTILGHFNQFFFLATFTWMTIMSYEIFKQIHGMSHMVGGHNSNTILKQLLVGYGAPLFIVLVTIIVELSSPLCASFSPRFGHKSCLFFGKLDKFLWLYGPILVMLLINTVMFIYITINVVQNQKTGAADSVKTGTRKEKLDKICLYLRLFLGMGVIWYFELLSFALSTDDGNDEWAYFTDCLNMLQGVWVFITFVCKRNVLKVITRKTDRLYSGILRTKSEQGGGESKL